MGAAPVTATRPERRGGRIVVNESFRNQKVTGQQRYATEIANRLADRVAVEQIRPTGWWSGSALRTWIWVQSVLPLRTRGSLLLSMTARAPLWGRRQVLVVHDLFVLTNPEWFSRRYVLTHAPLLRAQLKRARALVAVSEPVADQLRSLYRVPIMVASNAPSDVFNQAVDSEAESTLAGRGLVPGQYFLTVGNADPRKNLGVLARAYGELDADERAAYPLVVVGGSFGFARSESIDWPAGTIVTGYVDDEELRQLYAGSTAVVFPSRAEGFGLPLVEAAAAGASTLVISDLPVFRWICGDQAHFVEPDSVQSVAAGLREAIADPIEQTVDLSRFDWDASAETIEAVCLELVGGSNV